MLVLDSYQRHHEEVDSINRHLLSNPASMLRLFCLATTQLGISSPRCHHSTRAGKAKFLSQIASPGPEA